MLTKPELRQIKPADRQEELRESLKELIKVNAGIRNKVSKESHQVKRLRRHIARIKTIEREEEMKEKKMKK